MRERQTSCCPHARSLTGASVSSCVWPAATGGLGFAPCRACTTGRRLCTSISRGSRAWTVLHHLAIFTTNPTIVTATGTTTIVCVACWLLLCVTLCCVRVTAGGLTTTFYHDTAALALDETAGDALFEQPEKGACLPRPGADVAALRTLGAMLRQALLEGRVVQAASKLPLCLFRVLLRRCRYPADPRAARTPMTACRGDNAAWEELGSSTPLSALLEEYQAFEHEQCRSLRDMLQYSSNGQVSNLCQTFEGLKPDGGSLDVTLQNREVLARTHMHTPPTHTYTNIRRCCDFTSLTSHTPGTSHASGEDTLHVTSDASHASHVHYASLTSHLVHASYASLTSHTSGDHAASVVHITHIIHSTHTAHVSNASLTSHVGTRSTQLASHIAHASLTSLSLSLSHTPGVRAAQGTAVALLARVLVAAYTKRTLAHTRTHATHAHTRTLHAHAARCGTTCIWAAWPSGRRYARASCIPPSSRARGRWAGCTRTSCACCWRARATWTATSCCAPWPSPTASRETGAVCVCVSCVCARECVWVSMCVCVCVRLVGVRIQRAVLRVLTVDVLTSIVARPFGVLIPACAASLPYLPPCPAPQALDTHIIHTINAHAQYTNTRNRNTHTHIGVLAGV